MNTKKKNNPFQGPSFERYNALRQQLQKQNIALLRERSRIQQQSNAYQGIPSQNTIVEKNQLSIREEDEQDQMQIPHFEESNQSREKHGQIKRRQRSMREEINQKGEHISDNVMEMIEQIQRKALDQIQSLRADKISLMKRLNRQMKDHNHQKQKKSNHEERYSRQFAENKGGNIASQTKIRPEMPIPIQQQNSDQLSPSNRKYQPQQQQQQYPQFNSNEHSKNSQGPNRNIPQHQQPIKINNQNVIPSQSFYYVDKPSKIASANPNMRVNQPQQNNFEKQLNRLRQENIGLRQAYSQGQRSQNFVGDSHKARLKIQLSELYAKAKHFQQLLAHERNLRNGRAPNIQGSQVQTLLLQSANLAEEGQRLMRVKSNPQFNNSAEMIRSPIRYQANSQTGSRPFIEPSLMTPIQNSRGRNLNMNKFSPGQYEKLIDNMRRAANS